MIDRYVAKHRFVCLSLTLVSRDSIGLRYRNTFNAIRCF